MRIFVTFNDEEITNMKILIDDIEVQDIRATAKEFKVSVKTIYDWLNAGDLESKRHGNRQYITKESIKKWKVERNKRGF